MIITVFIIGMSLFGLVIIALWLYRDYQVDVFRENLFELRNELFDFAATGGIPFDDPAYRGLRAVCNGYIRFGHRVSFLPGFLFSWSLTREEKEQIEEEGFTHWWTTSATSDLDVDVVRALDKYKERMEKLVGSHLILGSPLLVFTVVPAVVLIVAIWLPIEVIKVFWQRMIDEMDQAVYDVGGQAA